MGRGRDGQFTSPPATTLTKEEEESRERSRLLKYGDVLTMLDDEENLAGLIPGVGVAVSLIFANIRKNLPQFFLFNSNPKVRVRLAPLDKQPVSASVVLNESSPLFEYRRIKDDTPITVRAIPSTKPAPAKKRKPDSQRLVRMKKRK